MKRAVITGATGGIGTEVCKWLADNDYYIIAGVRNEAKGKALAEICNSRRGGNGSCIQLFNVDLEDFKSVDEFIGKIKEYCTSGEEEKSIDLLINNAGIIAPKFAFTKDLNERMLQVNYLSPRRIAEGIIPYMNQAGGKIVNTVSMTINFSNLNDDRSFGSLKNYGRSKLYLALYTLSLNKFFREKRLGIMAVAADPGVVNTNIITMHKWFDPLADKIFRPFIKTPKRGAAAIIKAIKIQGKLHTSATGKHFYSQATQLCTEKKIKTFREKIYKIAEKNKFI